jgi:hypothetical protein
MEGSSYVSLFSRLLWAPGTIEPGKPFDQEPKQLRIGLLGMAGLCFQLAWQIPKDFIVVRGNATVQALVNTVTGIGIGVIGVVLMVLLETGILQLCGFKGTGSMVQGSAVTWSLLPFVAIPISAMFPAGITASTHGEITIVLVCAFLCWHAAWLGILISHGHFRNKTAAPVGKSRVVLVACGIAGIEILLTFLFLYFVPLSLGSSMIKIVEKWSL